MTKKQSKWMLMVLVVMLALLFSDYLHMVRAPDKYAGGPTETLYSTTTWGITDTGITRDDRDTRITVFLKANKTKCTHYNTDIPLKDANGNYNWRGWQLGPFTISLIDTATGKTTSFLTEPTVCHCESGGRIKCLTHANGSPYGYVREFLNSTTRRGGEIIQTGTGLLGMKLMVTGPMGPAPGSQKWVDIKLGIDHVLVEYARLPGDNVTPNVPNVPGNNTPNVPNVPGNNTPNVPDDPNTPGDESNPNSPQTGTDGNTGQNTATGGITQDDATTWTIIAGALLLFGAYMVTRRR